jgi:hypothetical protein
VIVLFVFFILNLNMAKCYRKHGTYEDLVTCSNQMRVELHPVLYPFAHPWHTKWMVTDMLPIAGDTFSEESLVGCKEAREVFVEMFPSLLCIKWYSFVYKIRKKLTGKPPISLCINTSKLRVLHLLLLLLF